MHITLMIRSIVLNEDLPEGFNEKGISSRLPSSDPVYLYLQDLMTDDEWYSTHRVILKDGRMMGGDHEIVEPLEDLPVEERWKALQKITREEAALVLSSELAKHGMSGIDPELDAGDVASLLRKVIAQISDTASPFSIQTLANILSAVSDCEHYPFSRDIAEFRDWPFVDVTEFQETDLDYGQEAIFIVDLHI